MHVWYICIHNRKVCVSLRLRMRRVSRMVPNNEATYAADKSDSRQCYYEYVFVCVCLCVLKCEGGL